MLFNTYLILGFNKQILFNTHFILSYSKPDVFEHSPHPNDELEDDQAEKRTVTKPKLWYEFQGGGNQNH